MPKSLAPIGSALAGMAGSWLTEAMLITLPMYDYPELSGATEAWASAIARHAGSPALLSRPEDYAAAWSRADLAFSQTCGYPFTHAFRNRLSLVGTPHYAVPGCRGFHYSSTVFAREKCEPEGYRGMAAAVNTPDSMSGMLALKSFFIAWARDGRFFGRTLLSGGHVRSLEALQRGEADVCAIDAVCVAYVRRYRPGLLEGLHELGETPRVPGLPYVTRDGDAKRWQEAVAAAMADPGLADVRAALMIGGFTLTQRSDYDAILDLEARIEASGGLRLLA